MQTFTMLHKQKAVEKNRFRKAKNDITQQALAEWAKGAVNFEKMPQKLSIICIGKNVTECAAYFSNSNAATKCHPLATVSGLE